MIALNYFLQRTAENKLFGKVGFQTQSERTDSLILLNLKAVEAALKAGKLKDLSGNVVTTGAVITIYARVDQVTEGGESRSPVISFRDADGNVIDATADTQEEAAPFDV